MFSSTNHIAAVGSDSIDFWAFSTTTTTAKYLNFTTAAHTTTTAIITISKNLISYIKLV